MLTIMINVTIREGLLDNFIEMASLITRETRGKHQGCISYSFNQRIDSPREFVLHEQWESETALNNHMKKLVELIGPERPNTQLPEKLLSMYEKGEAVYYNELEPNA